MPFEILKIAFLCITVGVASIPLSFTITSSPTEVWLGNMLGSVISAIVVITIGDHITNRKFKNRVSKRPIGKKVVTIFESTDDNKKVRKARIFIDNHGLRIFAFLCPIFPGVLLSTAAVYWLDLNKQIFKRWMLAGVVVASGIYVYGYWWFFVRL